MDTEHLDQLNVKLRKIQEADLELIMDWRMRPEITKYMNTDPTLTLEGQKKWLERINHNHLDYYWMIEVDGVPAGIASLVEHDEHAKKIHTGVYIAEKKKRSIKLTVELQWNLYEYAFDVLGLNKVCEEVFSLNKAVLRILDMCGSKREGELRQHVYKNGEYYDVSVRGILRNEWEELKQKINYTHFVIE
jgi:UDP-4-amino-4,6-dideoxy-N-acetyl-beta-L-altrosamine N-acetyltransferase